MESLGQRERAVNEYRNAKQANDDTGGTQATAKRYLKKAYSEGGTSVATPAAAEPPKPAPAIATPASGEKPILKKPAPPQP